MDPRTRRLLCLLCERELDLAERHIEIVDGADVVYLIHRDCALRLAEHASRIRAALNGEPVGRRT